MSKFFKSKIIVPLLVVGFSLTLIYNVPTNASATHTDEGTIFTTLTNGTGNF